MNPRPSRLPALLCALLALPALAAADNHKWEIREIFSSADESVQFVELFNGDKDEHLLAGMTLTTASGSLFVFPSNLSSSATENRHVLLATAAFAAIPGAPTPDYILPAGFLERLGDTLTYTSTPHAVGFGALPSDGLRSINASGVQAINSPTNFANQTGSITLATATVRNGSGVNALCYSTTRPAMGSLWQLSVNTSAHPGASAVLVIGYGAGVSGPILTPGQLLVSPASGRLFQLQKAANGGTAVISQPIPNDMAYFGATAATQALIVGGGMELCNAVDVKIAR